MAAMAQVLRILYLTAFTLGLCAADGGTVEVTVVDSITGAVIPGVKVELAAPAGNGLKFRNWTGPSGELRVADLTPGEHSFSFEKDGYGSEEQTTVRVAAQGIVHLRKELDPLTTMNGRVLDPGNRGIRRISVELLTGRGQYLRAVSADDVGAFQVRNLHPGVYLLRAIPDRAALQTSTLRAPSYYPGVPTVAAASPIRVNGEKAIDGCDIRLSARTAFAIRGRVVGPAGNPVAQATVKLKSADAHYLFEGAAPDAQALSDRDGRFEFSAVSAGHWHLWGEAEPSSPASGKLMGFVPVAVTESDRDGVNIQLARPFQLEVTIDGAGLPVHLLPVDGPLEQEVHSGGPKDGKIAVDRVYPGRYRFYQSTPKGEYLDAILLRARDVLGQEVDLAEGAPPIRMVYKQAGGSVRGIVAEGGGATVVLVPELSLPDYWRSVKSDEEARFEVADLRPGNYYAIVVRKAGALQDPTFAALVEQEGQLVHVGAAEIATVQLRLTAWPR
jgi:hypothetical protein